MVGSASLGGGKIAMADVMCCDWCDWSDAPGWMGVCYPSVTSFG